ncbi:hypothetical protein OB919_21365 [Halobacteria archaeon AArc-curdl1]|uniref:PRC-barrel domain containing protein n=1 Tax=Natronosalvus hydrolyticus TaxID=2979988 RepID=A0AAP2ZC17_9EURY|nr:hypothetical protein [Halobacteria archaeon AArc-curdl1]
MTEDDIGKTVVNANGESIGMVTAIQHGTAHVEPDPGITDSIKAKLGWGDTDEDAYPLQESSIEHVTDDEIRLQSDLGHDDSGRTQNL